MSGAIAHFFLYGDPPRPAEARFAHLELLGDRSRPANWTIRPHTHHDLHHVFLLASGAGRADADGAALTCRAPCIVAVPAGVVHGFRWRPETQGQVLTFSDAFLRELALREPALSKLFAAGAWTAAAEGVSLTAAFERLARELGWAAPGHDLAIEAHLAAILVDVLRLRQHVDRTQTAPSGQHAILVARLRELIEQTYRQHPSIEACAAELAVTPGRLRAACRSVARASPAALLQQRLALEAQRLMRYSNMSVAQVATYLGFEDAAYFSRFFSKHCGQSPRAYKRGAAAAGDAGKP